jgi:hypothetical protein
MQSQAPRQFCVFVFLGALLVHSAWAQSGNSGKPLRVTLTAVSQQNCAGQNTSEASVVHLKLRLEITNLSDRKLIVTRAIGASWYGIIFAKDEQAVAAGAYETQLNIDWALSKSELQTPPIKAPPVEFTILSPGNSFQVKSDVYIPVNGLLRPGDHVLQLDLGTWPHVIPAEQFRESWKKYGELVYDPVKSEPLPFHLPPEADFTKCRF